MAALINWILIGAGVLIIGIILIVKRAFVKESLDELKKVTWPTRELALTSATVTIIFVVVFSLMLAVLDYFANLVVKGMVK
jgi:preprotein translocase SecE subunit